MLVQMGLVSKTLVTPQTGAFIWFISLVKVHVGLKTTFFGEPSIANFTLERFLAIVGPYVNLKSLDFGIRFFATWVWALEFFMGFVSFQMLS